MTITREKDNNHVVFHCDGCPEAIETEEEDFSKAFGVAQRLGWTSVKVGHAWTHFCTGCQEE